jgi:DNA-binding response OmpR family regulator
MSDRARILVVDDEPFNVEVLEQELELLEHATITARNGGEALKRLAEGGVDLVLLDVNMPGLDGFAVIERMREHHVWRHIPVVLISAMTDMASVVRGIELGAEDYLPKPFEPQLLKARIGACLERKRLHDQEAANLTEIERQRARASRLLHAILPAPAVAELEATEEVRPRRFEDVVSDVVAFTRFCDANPPDRVMANLQALALAFEAIVHREELEPVGMVGDAFLAAAALFSPHSDPVMACVRAGHELIGAARSLPCPWEVRVGIHTGPVMAGMVGSSKLRFDLWGDTVNVAARLASLGGQGGVFLSPNAHARTAGRLEAIPTGPVLLKGKGETTVWQVPMSAE